MGGIAEDSVRFAHSGPSHNLLRPAIAELVFCGPLPLPVSAGGHASAIPPILPIIMYVNRNEANIYDVSLVMVKGRRVAIKAL